MRIVVFGAGALGSLMGFLLSNKHSVALVGRRRHVEAISADGLFVEGLGERARLEASTGVSGLAAPDLILITVKAYDTEEASAAISPIVGEDTIVASLQNGLGNMEKLAKAHGQRVVGGVTSWGSTLVEPGRVRFAGRGETIFGSPAGRRDLAERVSKAFSESGVESEVTDNIEGEIWMKAIVNASINPITAIVRSKNSCIQDSPELREIASLACEEGAMVAVAAGVRLPPCDPFNKVMGVVASTRDNRSSMLQDIEAGRRTEIEEISGAIARKGGELRVQTPTNVALWRLVKFLEGRAIATGPRRVRSGAD